MNKSTASAAPQFVAAPNATTCMLRAMRMELSSTIHMEQCVDGGQSACGAQSIAVNVDECAWRKHSNMGFQALAARAERARHTVDPIQALRAPGSLGGTLRVRASSASGRRQRTPSAMEHVAARAPSARLSAGAAEAAHAHVATRAPSARLSAGAAEAAHAHVATRAPSARLSSAATHAALEAAGRTPQDALAAAGMPQAAHSSSTLEATPAAAGSMLARVTTLMRAKEAAAARLDAEVGACTPQWLWVAALEAGADARRLQMPASRCLPPHATSSTQPVACAPNGGYR
jgi:hypothetical protein